MKKLLFISFLFCGTKLFAQTANAGADVTIYSTSTSTATLNGSASSGTSYLWTDISANIGYPMLMSKGIEGHPTNTGTITSSTSKTTTVTGLDQGTWYYQIAVTTGATTRYDTTIVNVDYTPPPSGGTLIKSLSPPIFSQIRSAVNTRYDTTNDIENEATTSLGEVFFQRGRLPGAYVDTLNGKFYAVIEDGYAWNGNGYDRSEVHFQGSTWNNGMGIDSNKTYVFEWRGYYPQNMDFLGVNLTVETLMQIHGDDGGDNPFGFYLINGTDGANELRGTPGVKGLYFEDQVVAATTLAGYYFIDNLSEFTNKAHTLRMIIREGKGYPGQDAFVKVEYDGVQMYYRDTGDVGRTWQRDYPKAAGIYDYNNAIVSPSNLSRGRKFGLVTEKYNVYELSGGSITPPLPVSNTLIKYGNNIYK